MHLDRLADFEACGKLPNQRFQYTALCQAYRFGGTFAAAKSVVSVYSLVCALACSFVHAGREANRI